ncbi:hypothetical protein C0991_007746, partial [Blastosporella zonata]
MQTCSTIYQLLLPNNNPTLYGAIYRHKFDTAAVSRRAFCPTPAQCTVQLQHVIAAMRVFRRGSIYTDVESTLIDDIGLLEALQIAFVMMLDDDGRNAAQLLLWGRADVFVKKLVRCRLYENSEENDGWPFDDDVDGYALWVLWMLTSEESLLKETAAERAQIQRVLLPFVYIPFRYSTSFAPPHHFLLPPGVNISTTEDTTIDTVHGPYPIYRRQSSVNCVYYDSRCTLACPPAAAAATLLFLARSEVTPMPIAEHFRRTRADRHAAGVFEVGPTRENIEEFNWGWGAHLSLGTGLHKRSGERKMIPGWGGLEWSLEEDVQEAFPIPIPDQGRPGFHPPPPVPRWIGKAPHALATGGGTSRSRKWDMDWNRARFCGDLYRPAPRIPYGKVYEPGAIDGLWQGSLIVRHPSCHLLLLELTFALQIAGLDNVQRLLQDPHHPPYEDFTEQNLAGDRQPMFVRFRELHGIQGEVLPPSSATDVPFGFDPTQQYDGMMNGWFSGQQAPVQLPDDHGKVRVQVGNDTATFHCWKGDGAQRLGNDAYTSSELATGEVASSNMTKDDAAEVQYEHNAATCPKCVDLKEFRRLLRLLRNRDPNDDANIEDADGLLSPWDPEDDIDGEGSSSPPAHDWDRRARERCDGIRDIIIVGEPDPEHAAAFEDFIFYGRIRQWDGMVHFVRVPKEQPALGTTVFYGNLVGRDTIVGNSRWGATDPGNPGWE